MTLIIERLNGKKYNLEQLGIRVVEFEPESPNIRNEVVELDGGGVVAQERGYGSRYISAEFRIHNRNLTDYAAFRSEIFELFGTTERFYITDTKEPFKRWDVRSDGNFNLSRAIKNGEFIVNFVCVKIFAESVFSSLGLQNMQGSKNIKQWDIDVWTWNSGIDWDSTYQYNFTSNYFSVNNLGNAAIYAARDYLNINLLATARDYLEIKNITTGDVFRFNGSLNTNQNLNLIGVMTTLDGVSVFSKTNKKLLSLAVGKNDFVITGGEILNINFDFRFLYK